MQIKLVFVLKKELTNGWQNSWLGVIALLANGVQTLSN